MGVEDDYTKFRGCNIGAGAGRGSADESLLEKPVECLPSAVLFRACDGTVTLLSAEAWFTRGLAVWVRQAITHHKPRRRSVTPTCLRLRRGGMQGQMGCHGVFARHRTRHGPLY